MQLISQDVTVTGQNVNAVETTNSPLLAPGTTLTALGYGGNALVVNGNEAVIIGGTLLAALGAGLELVREPEDNYAHRVTVQRDAVISAVRGIESEQFGFNITNAGSISGAEDGIDIAGGGTVLVNSGSIWGGQYGVSFGGVGGSKIINTGEIFGGFGSLSLSDGVDSVVNRGTLDSCFLDGGNDVFDGRFGLQTFVAGGTGTDLIATGSGDERLYGGPGNDILRAGDGDDKLDEQGDEAAGADQLYGGAGGDTYFVDNLGDKVFEANVDGVDLVRSAVNFTLGQFVENLSLSGTTAIVGRGNQLSNAISGSVANNSLDGGAGSDVLNGGAGNDTIAGGLGSDTLIGGAGNDRFLFNTALSATNVDRIVDFNVAGDRIGLDNAVMSALGAAGPLGAAKFWASAAGVAHDANDRIIYETDSGGLYYDADGNGAGVALLVARLATNLALNGGHFVIV